MRNKFTVYSLQFTVFLLLLLFPVTYNLLPTFAQSATLSLSPSKGTYNKSCAFPIDIILDTGGQSTDGTDAILFYDTSKLTATSITVGTIYQEYLGNSIDETNGKITISGLAAVTSAFSGKGTLASVNFMVKDGAAAGAVQIKFDFDASDKAKTIDSNVVQRTTVADILGSVVNGNYTIGAGTACASGAPAVLPATGGISTPSAQIYKTLPPAGGEKLTFTLGIMGATLTILGMLGLALL